MMSTTTTTDEPDSLLLHLNGVPGVFNYFFYTFFSKRALPLLSEDRGRAAMHACISYIIYHVYTQPSTFSFLVRRLCLLQSL
jgi:hypothetical protein